MSREAKAAAYDMNPPDSNTALAPHCQNHKTYAQFDMECGLEAPGVGKIRVIKAIDQDTDDKI